MHLARRLLPALLAAVLLVLSIPAASEAARTVWLCKPGKASNPCTGSLATTAILPDGSTRPEPTRRLRRPPVDCFYAYPTVSGQAGANATLRVDPELRSAALYQAARFSAVCRVYAPVYRQVTVPALFRGDVTPETMAIAYRGIRGAWRNYLRRHNRGRGVVLIGHSQGAGVLTRLAMDEVDGKPAVRRRLVSAILLGGNVAVRPGRRAGGHFDHIPSCRSARETGCLIAYSSFSAQPPPDSLFGRATNTFFPSAGSGPLEVVCTNPGALGGGTARLESYAPTAEFAGPLGLVVDRAPAAPTPWVHQPDFYSGRCMRGDGAHWLQLDRVGVPGDVRPSVSEPLGPAWGLHLIDLNVALGDLVAVVRRQSLAHLRGD